MPRNLKEIGNGVCSSRLEKGVELVFTENVYSATNKDNSPAQGEIRTISRVGTENGRLAVYLQPGTTRRFITGHLLPDYAHNQNLPENYVEETVFLVDLDKIARVI